MRKSNIINHFLYTTNVLQSQKWTICLCSLQRNVQQHHTQHLPFRRLSRDECHWNDSLLQNSYSLSVSYYFTISSRLYVDITIQTRERWLLWSQRERHCNETCVCFSQVLGLHTIVRSYFHLATYFSYYYLQSCARSCYLSRNGQSRQPCSC